MMIHRDTRARIRSDEPSVAGPPQPEAANPWCRQRPSGWRFRDVVFGRRPRLRGALLPVAVLGLMAAPPAAAQDLDRELAALRREILELRQEVDNLRQELRNAPPRSASPAASGVAGMPGTAPPATVENSGPAQDAAEPAPSLQDTVSILKTQVADQAQAKVESNSKLPVRIFGMLVSNTFFNTGEPAWIDSPDFVLARRPDVPGGSFSSTLRQSRIGAVIDGPSMGSIEASGLVSIDFNGGLANFSTGQVMGIPRLLYGYVRLEGERTAVEIGQDQMILAPRNPTSLAALYFPDLYRSGNLYLRVPQIRVEQKFSDGGTGHFLIEGGMLTPVAGDFRLLPPPGFTPPSFGFILPNLAGDRSRRPAWQGRMAWQRGTDRTVGWDVAISGHDSRARFSNANTVVSRAGALDFDAHAGPLGIGGEWFIGKNIDSFGGSIGQPAKSYGGFLEGRLKASQRLDLHTGFGIDRLIDRKKFPASTAANSTWFGNFMYQFMPEIVMSFEYRWTSTRPGAGDMRRNHHFNLAFAYSF